MPRQKLLKLFGHLCEVMQWKTYSDAVNTYTTGNLDSSPLFQGMTDDLSQLSYLEETEVPI